MQAAKRVAVNTGITYGRMILTVGISLFSTRIVLNALGSVDYGIFNLIAGIIAMLSFLNVAMSASTQRFLSFHQGVKDINMQKKIFTNSLFLHIIIGVLIVIGLEISGLFLFDKFLNIPYNRISAAKNVFHFMSITVFFTVLSVPFTALLNAHENMLTIAIVGIIEVVLKLGIALFLTVALTDKLIVYGILTACVSVLSMSIFMFYSLRKYPECTIKGLFKIDKLLITELTSFAGWNLFGTLCALGRTQGLAILLNIFFGAVVNAAYGIANQVASQLNFFSVTLLQALNPQIMKSEGANDRMRMLRLSMIASKFGFYLLAFIAIPCIFEMPMILKFWLKNVPEYAIVFCQLILIGTLTNQLTIGVQSGLQATGKIKLYQAIVGTTILMNVPVSYLLLRLGFPSYSVLISFIFIELFACSLRLVFLKNIAGLSLKEYFERVFLKELIPLITIISISYLLSNMREIEFRFLITVAISAISFIIAIYLSGLCEDEKELVNQFLKKISNRLIKS